MPKKAESSFKAKRLRRPKKNEKGLLALSSILEPEGRNEIKVLEILLFLRENSFGQKFTFGFVKKTSFAFGLAQRNFAS